MGNIKKNKERTIKKIRLQKPNYKYLFLIQNLTKKLKGNIQII
jgi:hypothetical protein